LDIVSMLLAAGCSDALAVSSIRQRVQGPDALRGLASVGVALHHMAHFAPVESVGAFYFARGFLGLGVPLFFMISAFALSVNYSNNLRTPDQIS
jgi:peptidoglycan/LPS O-acetylase OafA/YrhL